MPSSLFCVSKTGFLTLGKWFLPSIAFSLFAAGYNSRDSTRLSASDIGTTVATTLRVAAKSQEATTAQLYVSDTPFSHGT